MIRRRLLLAAFLWTLGGCAAHPPTPAPEAGPKPTIPWGAVQFCERHPDHELC